ncbi:MAG: heat-inducible transcription repressor HrcA [Deltaproteobacteria bacterium RBG_13_60_28]|nr:MAG: heat-inducible transcription repressor HrcA [Deltaproteobacteria bacterium RBG_13_60_28]
MMEFLGDRDTRVLKTVVVQYITTGEPVGSRTVAKLSGLNLSPASIRNLMTELEERGFLRQPHTSAGRLPTALGFRYYVDHVLPVQELAPRMQKQIKNALALPATEPQELFRQASRVLSAASGHPALVLAPRPQGMRLKHIQFINMGGDGVLTVLVAQDHQVQTRFVRSAIRYTQGQLDRFSQFLNELCQNLTLGETRRQILARMEEDKNLFDKMVSQALNLSRQALQNEEEEELYIEGTSQILDYPEFAADVEKIRTLFKAFEEKHHLITLLDQTLASQGVQIIISPDEHFPEVQLSVVASSYSGDRDPVGSLGVIGPMRMDYGRVIPIVRYTASMVTGLLKKWHS